jgi:hypothetical protein
VSKKEVDSESLDEDEEKSPTAVIRSSLLVTPTMMQEDAPVIVDIEDFQYTYRCKHCGHEWSEIQKTERKYDAPKGYTGD